MRLRPRKLLLPHPSLRSSHLATHAEWLLSSVLRYCIPSTANSADMNLVSPYFGDHFLRQSRRQRRIVIELH
jgi:hypothetical protein